MPACWYGKSKAAPLFGTGPCFGWSSQEVLGWVHAGGGQDLFDERMAKLRLNVVSTFNAPIACTASGPLLGALEDGQLMAAGFDCYEVEPGSNPAFAPHENIFMLPTSAVHPARPAMQWASAPLITSILSSSGACRAICFNRQEGHYQ